LHYRHKSPGSSHSNRSIYPTPYFYFRVPITRALFFVAEGAQLQSMENSSLREYNKLCRPKVTISLQKHWSPGTVIDRLQATPYFHFRFGTKYRQTRIAWVNGKISYDHRTLITVHSLVFALQRWISGQKQSSDLYPTPYFYFR